MHDKTTTSLKWLNKVFDGLGELERDILFHIEHSSFDENTLDKRLDNLRNITMLSATSKNHLTITASLSVT